MIEDFEKKIGKDKFEVVVFYVNFLFIIILDEMVYCKVDKIECNVDYFKVFFIECIDGFLK